MLPKPKLFCGGTQWTRCAAVGWVYPWLSAVEVVVALNAVYDVLTPYLNHFVASRRIVSKRAHWSPVESDQSKAIQNTLFDEVISVTVY